MCGASAIALGDAEIVVAGGMESMSNAPHYLRGLRSGVRLGNAELVDGMIFDGLTDVYDQVHMGICAEECASRHGITRAEQDAFALDPRGVRSRPNNDVTSMPRSCRSKSSAGRARRAWSATTRDR